MNFYKCRNFPVVKNLLFGKKEEKQSRGLEEANFNVGVIKGLNGKPIKCTEKVNSLLSVNLI